MTGGRSADGKWFVEEREGRSRLSLAISAHLHTETTPYQRIDVYRSPFFGTVLTLDDLVMLTERDEFVYHEMLIHVPLLSHPEPRDVLIIGGGDTGCVREALRHDTVRRVVQCEIDERVTAVCADHFPWVEAVRDDPRVDLVFDDGVAYIEQHRQEFDLIVVDSTDPVGPAVGLFRRDFYAKVADALRPGGIMTAQTESPHWDLPALREIHAEISGAFPRVAPYLGAIPTYPGGLWSWCYASDRNPHDHFDERRAAMVAPHCRYWTPGLQRSAFELPAFVGRGLRGEDPFGGLDPERSDYGIGDAP